MSQPYQYQPLPPRPPKKKRPGWQVVLFLLVGGFAVLFVLIGIASAFSGDDSAPSKPRDPMTYSAIEAQVDCKYAVKDRHVLADGADFTYTATTNRGGTFEVRGYVDTENSFGGPARYVFGCQASDSGTVVKEWQEVSP